MNKIEAIEKMKQGVKVTHKSFTNEEWMTMDRSGRIILEDGTRCLEYHFWKYRSDLSWLSGYDVFCKEGERIYSQKDDNAYQLEWMQGLNNSGYAGINPNGNIVDRREFPKAVSIQENSKFGVVKPKDL